ncbi:MAG: tetratricopeptide repeat protein [Armatimonadetes bacterium]|nr:tetratricopeptide repeat protein [Armatimonadota bacterium]
MTRKRGLAQCLRAGLLCIVGLPAFLSCGCSKIGQAQARYLSSVHYNRALVAQGKREDDRARKELIRAVRLDPEHPEANLILAQYYLRDQEWKKASACLERVKSIRESKNTGLINARADLHDKLGEVEKAEEDYRLLLKREPGNPTAQNNLGYFLANHNKNLDEALALIQKAVKAEPKLGSFVDSLGWIYYRRGQYEEARQQLARAKRLEPKVAEIHYHLGIVLRDMKRPEDAKEEFIHAVDLDPKFRPAQEELRKLGAAVPEDPS